MARQDEINRMIVLIYASRNSAGFTNYTRKIDWLDDLPMEGLNELSSDFDSFKAEVEREIQKRIADGIPRYSRRWHERQEDERQKGEGDRYKYLPDPRKLTPKQLSENGRKGGQASSIAARKKPVTLPMPPWSE